MHYPNTQVLEDFPITPYLIAKSSKLKAIDYVGYHYLKYDSSLSTNLNKNAIEKLKTFREMVKLAKYYISKTTISIETKELYYKDVENRYNIRKKVIKQIKKNKRRKINKAPFGFWLTRGLFLFLFILLIREDRRY